MGSPAKAAKPLALHLLRARDLADARYAEPLTVAGMARPAGLSAAHFSQEFRRAFGESPHRYLLTRRLERADALLRVTDWPVADICFSVGAGSAPSPWIRTGAKRAFGLFDRVSKAPLPCSPASEMRLWPGRAWSMAHLTCSAAG